MAQDQGLFGQLGIRFDNISNEFDNFSKNRKLLDTYINVAGQIGGAIGDTTAAGVSAITPQPVIDFAKEILGEGYARYANSPLGKEIATQIKENPESAKLIGNTFNILGAVPVASLLKNSVKKISQGPKNIREKGKKEGLVATLTPEMFHNIAEQMPVHMRGGKSVGDVVDLFRTLQNKFGKLPANKQKLVRTLKEIATGTNKKIGTGVNFYGTSAQQILAMMGEGIDAVGPALNAYFNPQQIANRRVKAVPERSIKEIAKLRKEGRHLDADGEAAMQTTIALLNNKYAPLLNKQNYTGAPRSLQYDLPKIKEELFGGKSGVFNPIPESIANRHLAHLKVAHGLDNTQDIKILVKRPHKDLIGREVAGAGYSTGSVLQRGLANGSLLKTWKSIQTQVNKKLFKGDIPSEGMIEMMQISGGLSKSNIMKFNKAYNKNNKTKVEFGAQDILTKLVKARELRSRGLKYDKKILDTWEINLKNPMGKVRDDLGNVISNAKSPLGNAKNYNGGAHISTSYISSNKELGGMNQAITAMLGKVDPSQKGMVYTTGSDVGNLLGVGGRTGGNQVITAVPTQTVNYLKRDFYTEKKLVKHKAQKNRWTNFDSLDDIRKNQKQNKEMFEGMTDYDVPIRLGDWVEAVIRNGRVVLISSQVDQIDNSTKE